MRLVVLLLCVAILAPFSAGAADRIYTSPVKSGENPAAVAAPRDDWYANVQAKFERFSGKPADIIFDGDSITNRWETTGKAVWTEHFKNAADFGIEGDRVENVMWRLSKGQVDGVDPKLVVLMIGTNNTGRDNAEQIADGIKQLVVKYLECCPHAELVLMAVFPRGETATDGGRVKVNAINSILATFERPRVHFVDIAPKLLQADGTISRQMMPDFVHPNVEGYQIWADAIRSFVDQFVVPRR